MQITCYSAFSKKPNSTKTPTSGGTTKTCTLKQPTSIIKPVFLLTGDVFTYDYIQWGNRWYFVDDVISVHNNLTEYHCTVDPLATWKLEIGASSQYVIRAASSFDGLLQDELYPTKADITSVSQTLTGLNNKLDIGNGWYVVGIIGTMEAVSGSIAYYLLTPAQFYAMINFMFAGSWLDQSQADMGLITQKELVNPFQYIVSCIWLPYDIYYDGIGTQKRIHFGWWVCQDGLVEITGILLTSQTRYLSWIDGLSLTAHPEAASRGNYLNSFPYTKRTAYIFAFGEIPLDLSPYVSSLSIRAKMELDLFTGAGKLVIMDSTDTYIYSTHYAMVGIPIQLAQISQSVVTPITDLLGSAAYAAHKNFLGAASGIASAVKDMMPQVKTVGANGTVVDIMDAPRIVSQFRYQSQMDETHNGRPLCQVKQINTLSGYIKCEGADLGIPGTSYERDTIVNMLNNGFYYE